MIAPTNRQADACNSVGAQLAVALAADPVEHHAGDADTGIEAGKPLGHGRDGLRLAGNVEHQQHRQTVEPGEIRRRAGPAHFAWNAVEQAHGAFEEHEVGARRAPGKQPGEQVRRPSPSCRD